MIANEEFVYREIRVVFFFSFALPLSLFHSIPSLVIFTIYIHYFVHFLFPSHLGLSKLGTCILNYSGQMSM